jgi:uncharacterized protein (DUF2267 family)
MSKTVNLDSFFHEVQRVGKLRTVAHAERWTRAVLQTFGLNLSRGVKRDLAAALPKALGDSLTDVFWLLHFRDTNQSAFDFQQRVARRAGNSDKEFARYPILAVFGGVKQVVNDNLRQRVADDLAPELRELWEQA